MNLSNFHIGETHVVLSEYIGLHTPLLWTNLVEFRVDSHTEDSHEVNSSPIPARMCLPGTYNFLAWHFPSVQRPMNLALSVFLNVTCALTPLFGFLCSLYLFSGLPDSCVN